MGRNVKTRKEDTQRMRLPGPLTELLVVGLGNITHPGTRHSVGHVLIDALAKRFSVSLKNESLYSAGKFVHTNGDNTTAITLVKTKPLMNISGRAVAMALRSELRSPLPSSLLVIHDSLDHKVLTHSPKFGGSPNGHNGVKSVIDAFGGDKSFHRIRIGIGRPEGRRVEVSTYVLSRLDSVERIHWGSSGEGTSNVWNEIEKVIKAA